MVGHWPKRGLLRKFTLNWNSDIIALDLCVEGNNYVPIQWNQRSLLGFTDVWKVMRLGKKKHKGIFNYLYANII